MASSNPSDIQTSKFSYQNGALSWGDGDGTSKLLDENIICATAFEAGTVTHNILSLLPIEEGSQVPFKLQVTHADSLPESFLERHLLKDLPTYLESDNKIYVLISTLSGTGLAESFFDEVLHQVLLSVGLTETQFNEVRTRDPNSVTELARYHLLPNAVRGRKQTVLLLSGDGGIVDTVNGLLERGKLPE